MATFGLQLLVVVLTTLVLLLPFWWVASRRIKSGPRQGEKTPVAQWLIAHVGVVTGFVWSVSMYMAMSVTPAVIGILHGKALSVGDLLFGAVIWGLGGLIFGSVKLSWFKRRKTSAGDRRPSAKI